eukprot:c13879_g1_i1.p1 GENE.c13879_g1_i1~~c13879_g1_i1.p1  ORF type:complete len:195 (-),score=50.29 c13879_g1_i1:167-751(-)
MLKLEQITLDELVVERHQVKEVLACLLHTIMFHRALGPVIPEDVDSDLFSITYVKCNDPSVSKLIEERIDAFAKALENTSQNIGQICLSFYEKHVKHSWLFARQEERVYWEQWNIPISVISVKNDTDRKKREQELEKMILDRITFILRTINEKQEPIPPVSSDSIVSFPYEISSPQLAESWNIWKKPSPIPTAT